MKRSVFISMAIFALCILSIVLISCTEVASDSIEVTSFDYPGLLSMSPGEFDENWIFDIDSPYSHYNCYVSLDGGELHISNQSWKREASIESFNSGYFLGVNLPHYAGWVSYFPYGKSEGILIANDLCCGIIYIDNNNGYIITYDITLESGNGKLYELKRTPEYGYGEWSWRVIASFDGFSVNYYYAEEEKCFYLVTVDSIIVVDVSGNVTVITSSDLLAACSPNSIVRIGDSIYCGAPRGVYRYDIDTERELWYPMDYEKYVKTSSDN